MATEDTTIEIWKPIEEFPKYEVSNFGRIKRLAPGGNTYTGKVLNPWTQKKGYQAVELGTSKSERRTIRVHVLVANAFLPTKPTPKHEVNHIDGIKKNNFASNLEWTTTAENIRHAARLGLRAEKHGSANGNHKLKEYQVEAIWKLLNRGVKHRDIAKCFNVSAVLISAINTGRLWKRLHPDYDQLIQSVRRTPSVSTSASNQ